jgi:hypothetical protein
VKDLASAMAIAFEPTTHAGFSRRDAFGIRSAWKAAELRMTPLRLLPNLLRLFSTKVVQFQNLNRYESTNRRIQMIERSVMPQRMNFSLLTVLGKVTQSSVEATCKLHNETAGNPGGVAAAKALGDMSHMIYMPANGSAEFHGELLFLDIWNSIEGLQKFFSDPHVEAGGKMMFASKEAVVWNMLDGFLNFHFPSPSGKNEKVIGLVRGRIKSLEEAEAIHNSAIEKQVKSARAAGIVSHEFYVRAAASGSPEALEVLGVDFWMNGESMMNHYMSPEFQNSGLYAMFASKPASSTWAHPKGDWVEW